MQMHIYVYIYIYFHVNIASLPVVADPPFLSIGLSPLISPGEAFIT